MSPTEADRGANHHFRIVTDHLGRRGVAATAELRTIARAATEIELIHLAMDLYPNDGRKCQMLTFPQGSATYLFDDCRGRHAPRTVVVVGAPTETEAVRDVAYQRGYPLDEKVGGRPVDRGHFMPFSPGGEFGPNLFVQDSALNRGWSEEGGRYRSMERHAIAGSPNSLLFALPHYEDDSDRPNFVTLGVLDETDLRLDTFRNRYDQQAPLPLGVHLAGAVNSQIGALGEEIVSVLIEEELGATTVSMGDAGMPRNENRQDLDLVAIVDGMLTAIEVKTRYLSRQAGRLTRAGNLRRPRTRAGAGPFGDRQGSQPYIRNRTSGLLDTNAESYAGMDVLLFAVDLRLMLAQPFTVSDVGRLGPPVSPPIPCASAAERALQRILDHRGHL